MKNEFKTKNILQIYTLFTYLHTIVLNTTCYVRRENRFAVYSGNAGFEQHNLKALLSERKKKQ